MTMSELLLCEENCKKWVKEMELEASEYGEDLQDAWDELEEFEED